MKRFIQSLLLVAFFIGITVPAWAQSSTEGKEFWVALIPSSAPGDNHNLKTNKFDAYIAISAPKKCKVTVQNPQTGWSTTVNIPNNNSWVELKTDIGSGGDIPIKQWYTEDGDFPANETALKHGLKVTATEDISVFCCIRWEFSMDASNILPINAIQKDYIVQSYDPKGNGGTKKNNCTILAAEDCTVTIQLACKTNKNTTGTITPQLKAGQVYHLVSAENESLSGTKISSTGKIAVFAGSTCANVPAPKSDRDLLYEQLFPLDYWGQNFVVVRTKEKDANRVLITAQEDNTQVIIYGQSDRSTDKDTAPHETIPNDTITLNAGKSYEFEMSSGLVADATGDVPKNRWDDARKNSLNGSTFIDSAVYIKTSCPCAVLTYDVGSSYIRKTAENHWSKERMIDEIKFDLYHHQSLPNNFTQALPSKTSALKAMSMFKDNYLLEFVNMEELNASEKDVDERVLEQEIVQHIKDFIMAFGKDFAFVGNQYHLEKFGVEQFPDLLFYNRELAALVVVELKMGSFKPAYLGQLSAYLRILDDEVRKPFENPSIGIILCKDANQSFVEYLIQGYDSPMGVATYKTADDVRKVLPSEEELRRVMDEEI